MFVDPVFENVENSELNRLFVFFPESFKILPNLNVRLLVVKFGIGSRIRRKLGIGNIETLEKMDHFIIIVIVYTVFRYFRIRSTITSV